MEDNRDDKPGEKDQDDNTEVQDIAQNLLRFLRVNSIPSAPENQNEAKDGEKETKNDGKDASPDKKKDA